MPQSRPFGHGQLSAQGHSLGDKENSVRLGCAHKVLDYKLNHTKQHWCGTAAPESWPSAPLKSEKAFQFLPTPPSPRRNGRPSPNLITTGHLSRGALHFPRGLGKLSIQKDTTLQFFLNLLISSSVLRLKLPELYATSSLEMSEIPKERKWGSCGFVNIRITNFSLL